MKLSIKILTVLIVALTLVPMGLAQGKPAAPETQAVKFDGLNLKLAGTLTFPATAAGKRAPAILIVTGSGLSFGEAAQPGTDKDSIYRHLADALAERGYASLRFDRRCSGGSECRKPDSYDDFIDDAKGALEFLRKQERVDPKRIFLLGHGEGGIIASSIGSSDEKGLAGVLLASSPGRNLTKLMREQLPSRMRAEGRKPEEISAMQAKFERIIRGLTNGQVQFPEEKFLEKDPYDAMLQAFVKQFEIVVSLLINDPLQIAATVKYPVLIVQGRKDALIAIKDAQYLEEALKRVNHPDATLHLLDETDHSLRNVSKTDGPRLLDAGALTVINEWMAKR